MNGKVWPPGSGATAVAVAGDRVAAVADDDAVRERAGARAGVIDAGGQWIIPAFNDAHVHFLMASRSLGELDLFGAATEDEVRRRVADYAGRHAGPWIVGRGWLYSAFSGGMPSVRLLDELVPDRPAYLESYDAHTGWANSRALSLAGVQTLDVLKEEATTAVTRHLARPTPEQDLEALREGMRLAASRGIASVQEAGDGLDQVALWDELRQRGELTLRVRLAFDMTPGLSTADWGRRLDLYEQARARSDAWRSPGILKAFADRVVESRTAAMLEPYEGSDERGRPLWEKGELGEAVRVADARGWQVQVHAIGDAAIRQALDAFEKTTAGRRHRVEHVEAPAAADLVRFARLGVVASMQPQHADPDLTDVWRRNVGSERAGRGWPWRTLLESGARVAFGTDWPVVPLDPFSSLRVATGTHAAQRLDLRQAVDAWTSGGAYAEHAESDKGELKPGMLADIAVVDFQKPAVHATIAGGRVVFEG
ncbi:MAG TPA: amidohydrolase [Candidatus Dormibacteraeota bacterium]|nr:amidohydrolase [Candidatus Dormibacteraeota bacterium]